MSMPQDPQAEAEEEAGIVEDEPTIIMTMICRVRMAIWTLAEVREEEDDTSRNRKPSRIEMAMMQIIQAMLPLLLRYKELRMETGDETTIVMVGENPTNQMTTTLLLRQTTR